MKFAKEPSSGAKTPAIPKAHGVCFCCDEEMVAKCGEIKIHHWAHKSLQDVIIGGRTKLNGTASGRIDFRWNGRK